MGVSKETESEILRLHYAEKWKRGTIARQLHIHHGVVDRVLAQNGVDVERLRVRGSMIDEYVPFIRSVLEKYPKLTGSRLHAMVKESVTRKILGPCLRRISVPGAGIDAERAVW